MRPDEVKCGAVGLDCIFGTRNEQEAVAQIHQCGSRGGIGAVDGGGAERHAGVRRVTALQQSVTKAHVRLVRGRIGGILHGKTEAVRGPCKVAGGGESFTLIG